MVVPEHERIRQNVGDQMHGDISQCKVKIAEIFQLTDHIEQLDEQNDEEAGLVEGELKQDRLFLLGKLATLHLNVVECTDQPTDHKGVNYDQDRVYDAPVK